LLALRKSLGIVFAVAVLFALCVGIMLSAQRLGSRPRTDDAYIQADLVHLAPDVGGRIVSLSVRNNQRVHAGDVLFTIDQEPLALEVEKARAEVRGLEAKLDITGDEVASQTSKADAALSGVGSAQAQLALASSSLARIEPLLARGFVTAEQVDQARTAKRTAEVSLQQARQQAQEARKGISSVKPAAQQLVAERAALALAERNLRLAVVRAPCNGRISGLDIAAGEFAVAGHALFTIIDTDVWYAVGNFRETELAKILPGQHASVYLLANSGMRLPGMVESFGWGVSPDEGMDLGGLPHVPRSLSWVRIAQRFPVRIRLDSPPEAAMRVGESVVVVIER
jgi:multidrug efflux system membrane fusion protein